MKTKYSICMLGLAAMALFIVPLPVSANLSDLLEMSEQADQADKQDFQGALDRANDCTRARNFSCSEEQLRKASKLTNGSGDKRALNIATQNLQAEQQRVREEVLAKAERERQIQLAEARRRDEERAEQRRREEEDRAEERRRRAQREESASVASNSNNSGAWATQMPSWYAGVNQIHNETMQKMNVLVEQERAQKEAARLAQERAAADRRDEERANQRAAYDRRAQEQRAADDQRAQNERAARDQQAREESAAAERRAQEVAHQQEQARQQERTRKLAEAESAKRAEENSKKQYLNSMKSGIRLAVKNCYGEYHVGGSMPNIKPDPVGCINVHYRARCEGSSAVYDGVHSNYIGNGGGCFGDTSQISPKPACAVEQVNVVVTDVRPCYP